MLSFFDQIGRWKAANIFLYVCALLGFSISLLVLICKHYVAGWPIFHILVVAVFFIVAALLFFAMVVRNCEPERVFFLVGVPLALGFCFFLIPTNVPDEPSHIFRLFDNRSGQGTLVVPSQINIGAIWSYDSLYSMLTQSFDYSQVDDVVCYTSNYPVVNYILPSLFVRLGVFLGVNGWVLVYLASFVNAMVYCAIVYWTIKRIPLGKAFLVVFSLNPTIIQLVSSTSSDAFCITMSFLFVGQIVYMKFCRKIKRSDWAIVLTSSLLVLFCKYVYAPLLLLFLCFVLWLPSSRQRRLVAVSCFLCFVAVVFCFTFLLSSSESGSGILHSLFLFLSDSELFCVAYNTLLQCTAPLIRQFLGGNLGWPSLWGHPGQFEIPIIWIIYGALVLVATFASRKESSESALSKIDRLLFMAAFLCGSFLIFLGMGTTIVDQGGISASYVGNMQGRYFAPLFLVLGLSAYHPLTSGGASSRVLGCAAGLLGVASLLFIVRQLWVVTPF